MVTSEQLEEERFIAAFPLGTTALVSAEIELPHALKETSLTWSASHVHSRLCKYITCLSHHILLRWANHIS